MKLGVYSGNCYRGECGKPTGMTDCKGAELFVGDIVSVFHESHPHPEFPLNLCDHFTVVVEDGYTTYSDGEIKKENGLGFFVMGIKNVCNSCTTKDDNWSVFKMKGYEDVIDGEHWKAYGFNYKKIGE